MIIFALSPLSQRSIASSEKVEKVVKPPRSPIKISARNSKLYIANRLNMSRLKNPIKNEPETFTKSVPIGNAKGAID